MNKAKRVWVKNSDNKYYKIIKSCLELYETPKMVEEKDSYFVMSKINMLRYVCSLSYEGAEHCLRNILINCLLNAHRSSPGSEIWIPKLLVEDYKKVSNFRISSKEALQNTLKIMNNNRAKNIFETSIDLLGSFGKIVVENNQTDMDVIEIRSGYNVSLSIDKRFIEIIGKNKFYLDNANVLVIEGAPSSVSEINKILENAYKNKTQLLLVARSFPEEVSATLATNWLKNKLSIIPLVYGDRLENLNSHADILAISGGFPISKMLGDTLNVDADERFGYIYNVHVNNLGVTCHTDRKIHSHLRNLRSKIKESVPGEEDKNELIFKRISGLTSDLLSIKLKETDDVFLVKEELEIAIAYYNNMCYMTSKIMLDKEYIVPTNTINVAEELANSFFESVNKIGGFLIKT